MTMARVQDVALGGGLLVLMAALVACAAHQVLEVLAAERDRRERSSRPQLVGTPVEGTAVVEIAVEVPDSLDLDLITRAGRDFDQAAARVNEVLGSTVEELAPSRPLLVVPGCEVGRDGQSVDGAASAVPSPAPVPAVDDPPVGYVDDEIAQTVRRVHLDGSL